MTAPMIKALGLSPHSNSKTKISGPWQTAGITSKTKLVLSSVAAGGATNLRVTAVKDDVASAPSPVATVYPSADAAPTLRPAA